MEGSTSRDAGASKPSSSSNPARLELDDDRRRDDREKHGGGGRSRRDDDRGDRDDYRSSDKRRRDDDRDLDRPNRRSDRRDDDRRRERRPSPVGRENDREARSRQPDERRRDSDRDRNGSDRRRERDYDDDRRSHRRDDEGRRRRSSRSPPTGDNSRRDQDRSSNRRDARDRTCSITSTRFACADMAIPVSILCFTAGPSQSGPHGLPPLQTDEPRGQEGQVKQFVPPTKESILAERAKAAEAAPAKRPMRLIEVIANDRLGGKGKGVTFAWFLWHRMTVPIND